MFTVAVPTKNRPDDVVRFLDSVACQTILPSKILIIDQSFEETQVDFAVKYPTLIIEYYHVPQITGLCAAKNFAVEHIEGEYIYFFDDDIILDNNFFEVINNHFKNFPRYYGICGRQKNSKSSKLKVFFFELFHIGAFRDIRKKCNSGYIKDSLVQTNVLPGGITAYRKQIFEKYRFDEILVKYCLGEDMDFSYRVSQEYSLAFATDALALHNHSIIGRYDPLEAFACKVAGYAYFYKKNVKKTFFHALAYFLVKTGIFFDACAYSAKHRNLDAFRGLRRGRRYLKNDFRDVPFIDYNKYWAAKEISEGRMPKIKRDTEDKK